MTTKANDHFGSCNGSENFHIHRPSLLKYTDGVKEMSDTCESYWLIDLIISHQFKKGVNLQRFQTWDLFRAKDSAFDVIATDGNEHIIACQQIQYTKFKYDQATLWLVDGVLMLPKEY